MKKIFDIELGHYRIVNEDDNTGFAASESPQNQEGEQKAEDVQKQQQQNAQPEMNKSVEQNEKIQQINVELDAENKRYAAQKQTVVNTYNS